MDQLIEFVGNHAILSAGFVAVLLFLIWTEVSRRVSGISELTPSEAVLMMNRNNPNVVDVSPSADFNKAHIAGAKNIALSRFTSPDAEVQKLAERPSLVVCKNGITARQAAASLAKMGATEISVLKGGMTQWTSDNYPVTHGK